MKNRLFELSPGSQIQQQGASQQQLPHSSSLTTVAQEGAFLLSGTREKELLLLKQRTL